MTATLATLTLRVLAGLVTLLLTLTANAAPARVAVVYDGGESTGAGEVLRAASGLSDLVKVTVYAAGDGGRALSGNDIEEDLAAHDLVFVDGGSDNAGTHADLLNRVASRTRLVVVGPTAILPGNVAIEEHPDLAAYWRLPSQANYRGLLTYLSRVIVEGNRDAKVPAPRRYPPWGFYLADSPELLSHWPDNDRQRPPRIGIVFHRNHYLQDDLATVDALIQAVRDQQAQPIALAYSDEAPLEALLSDQGVPLVDAVVFHGTVLDRQHLEAGVARAQTLGVPVLSALRVRGQSEQAYRDSEHGLAPRGSGDLARGERQSLFEPLAVSADGPRRFGRRDDAPMMDQIEWRAARAVAWAHLHREANADKRVVFTFWSESGGKADLGADPDDFLDVPGSLIKILERMQERGYDIGAEPLPDRDHLARRLAEQASNIGGWAPESLRARAATDDVVKVPLARYQAWFSQLPLDLREHMTSVWGPPPGNIMVTGEGEQRALLLPALRFGNVLIAAHPVWGYLENSDALKDPNAVPPHHQYAAFFLWLQKQFKADAWVSLFSNIVLQPGKSEGPLADDAIGQLLGAVPHIHPERLGGAGGLANKRKALALTPGWYNLVVPTGELTTLAPLKAMLDRYDDLEGHEDLVAGARQAVRDEVITTGIDQALGWDAATVPFDRLRQDVSEYIQTLERKSMPYGTRVLGDVPEHAALAGMVEAMLAGNGHPEIPAALLEAATADGAPDIPSRIEGRAVSDTERQSALQAHHYAEALRGAPREIDAVLDALEGRWLEPGPMFSPLRRADSLPVGRNLYTFDPAIMPTPEAEAAGVQLARDTIETFREDHQGRYPQHLAFVLFSSETTRNQGINEAHILALLGVRVQRDGQGRVTGVARIPRQELGRPRVDVTVTTSGTYRDHYSGLMTLIDEAVRVAAAGPEDDNPIAVASQKRAAQLEADGVEQSEARTLSRARVFSTAPGAYSPNIQFLARSGDDRGPPEDMAALYRDRMGHVYGGGYRGDAMPALFSNSVKNLQAAVLPRSSDVNGMLDQPMSAAFLGGLDMAARAAGGAGAQLYVSRPAQAGAGSLQSAARAVQEELSTRYFNPRWIGKMQEHGYDGARTFLFLTDQMDLWSSTTDQAVRHADWAKVKAVYVDDEYQLDMHAFMDNHNPYAEQGLLANLLGAAEHGHWQASEQARRQVARRLVESTLAHGSACNANLCRNADLTRAIENALETAPGGKDLARRYRAALETATGQAPAPPSPGHPGAAPDTVTGRVMETVAPPPPSAETAGRHDLYWIVAAALALIAIGFLRERWRR